jgi:hypothetical protein
MCILLFRFVMQGFDAIPTPGICSVVVMQYLDHNGSIVLDFTPGFTVEHILISARFDYGLKFSRLTTKI